MSITLAELKTQARQLADMEDNNFVQDSELTTYINYGIARLYDLLTEAYGSEYFLTSTTATTTSNTSTYTLPTNFYKLKGVDVKLDNNHWLSIQSFNFNERNRFQDFGSWSITGITNIRYRIMGGNIVFTPTPDATIQYRLWYIPLATKLSLDADTLNDINQYADYVVLQAAKKMLNKEESSTSEIDAQIAKIEEDLQSIAQNRDAANPESISDIHAENNDYLWYSSRG